MSNQFGMKCPKCGDDDEIDIAANVWVRLTHDGTDCDASTNGDHEWDGNSACVCNACGHEGKVCDFEPKEDADVDPK